MMNTPIHDPLDFLAQLCPTINETFSRDIEKRACVITRSPAEYGRESAVFIEWEGSPPRFSICYGCGGLIVKGRKIKGMSALEGGNIIRRFLAAHPANADGSPVWVGTRFGDRP
jgi:hypothetical protein